MAESAEIVVVGAGIAGLACARALTARGVRTVVLERASGVGGRCATRRLDGVPVDHGAPFLNGRSPEMRAALHGVPPVERVEDWPRIREGAGLPCQPEAFEAASLRFGVTIGLSAFAKRMAEGLAVRLRSEVVALGAKESWELRLASGETMRAGTVVLTMPAPEVIGIVRALPERILALVPTLELIRTVPCLTVIARYPAEARPPAWEASYPGTSPILDTVLHDSTKRAPGSPFTIVLQAGARFSRKHLDDDPERWTRVMLTEARRHHGELPDPDRVETHVWRHARVAAPSQLAGPLAIELPSGPRLGFAGDGFHHAGGLEGAYLSGLALAERLAAFPTHAQP